MNKIIAICGASATGKDTLAKYLKAILKQDGYNVGILVSNTSRPPRSGEVDGVDYNFCSGSEFLNKGLSSSYLEYTSFNGWLYGTPKDALQYDINIGVFNPEGIDQLIYNKDIEIFVIYLKSHAYIRFKRSIEREGKFKLEMLKRYFRDLKSFWRYEEYLFPLKYRIVLNNINDVVIKGQVVLNYMNRNHIFLGK